MNDSEKGPEPHGGILKMNDTDKPDAQDTNQTMQRSQKIVQWSLKRAKTRLQPAY